MNEFDFNDVENKNSYELIEYEKILISVALNSSKACFEIVSKLEPIDFSEEKHQLIFHAIQDISNNGGTINTGSLVEKLKDSKDLEKVGGVTYITQILSYFFTDEGFEEYLTIIFKYSLRRRLERAIQEINLIKDGAASSVYDLVIQAQEKILNIKTDVTKDDAEELKQIVDRVVENTFKLMDQNNLLTGVTSGLIGIDNLTSGWQKGDFIILAARPSMGKTAFALNLATNAASKGKKVAIFSLEMPKEQLTQRILSSEASIDSKKIRTGQGLNDKEIKQLTVRAELVKTYNIVIDDTPGINILQLQSKIRKLQRDYGIEMCVIDYLQLLTGLPNRNENRQNEVSTISRQIKKIARELNIPIICLSQLSRSVESREDKRPIMSDLRDSGAIEQDADIIMFLYRDEYYKKEDSKFPGVADVIFAKHRNGSTGTISLDFANDYGKFSDKK